MLNFLFLLSFISHFCGIIFNLKLLVSWFFFTSFVWLCVHANVSHVRVYKDPSVFVQSWFSNPHEPHGSASSVANPQTQSSGKGEFPAGLKILVLLILQGSEEKREKSFWGGKHSRLGSSPTLPREPDPRNAGQSPGICCPEPEASVETKGRTLKENIKQEILVL